MNNQTLTGHAARIRVLMAERSGGAVVGRAVKTQVAAMASMSQKMKTAHLPLIRF